MNVMKKIEQKCKSENDEIIASTVEENKIQIDALKDEIRNLKEENDEIVKQRENMEASKKKVEIELIESQKNVALKDEEVLTFEIAIRGWKHKCKKLEMDIEQEKEVCTIYERETQRLRKNVLELETVGNKRTQKYNEMKQSLQNEIVKLQANNRELNAKLSEVAQNLLTRVVKEMDLEIFEKDKINLLTRVMEEMDKM